MGPLKMTKLLVAAALVASLTSMMSGAGVVATAGTGRENVARLSGDADSITWSDAMEFLEAVARELKSYEAGQGSGVFMRGA